MSALDAVELVDALYRRAVETAAEIDDSSLAEWMEEAFAAVGHDRDQAKALRAAIRFARKLATRYASGASHLPDWRNGVDEALGSRGWEPQLDLVRHALATSPSAELFEAMKARHRAVHFNEWMEGVAYEAWRAPR
ncbi:MAG TPA: hypothetical protein DCY40_01790 [Actinobacteria bacterium]|nr:hypothetical protein [Actinomycetota bacterium]